MRGFVPPALPQLVGKPVPVVVGHCIDRCITILCELIHLQCLTGKYNNKKRFAHQLFRSEMIPSG